jgi:hypothetical protein
VIIHGHLSGQRSVSSTRRAGCADSGRLKIAVPSYLCTPRGGFSLTRNRVDATKDVQWTRDWSECGASGKNRLSKKPSFRMEGGSGGAGGRSREGEKEKRSGVGLVVGRAVWEYAGSGIPFASGGQDIGQSNQRLQESYGGHEVINCDVVFDRPFSSLSWRGMYGVCLSEHWALAMEMRILTVWPWGIWPVYKSRFLASLYFLFPISYFLLSLPSSLFPLSSLLSPFLLLVLRGF